MATRGRTTWYELFHDVLVPAVLKNNHRWLRTQLEPWQLIFKFGKKNGALLLHGELYESLRHSKRYS